MNRRGTGLVEAVVIIAILAVAGWFLGPSLGLHITKTPAEKAKAAEAAVADKSGPVLADVQQNLHQGNIVLGEAIKRSPQDRLLDVMHGFFEPAQIGVDQLSPPIALDRERQWHDMALGLISDNASIRAEAERQRAADGARADADSKSLAKSQQEKSRWEKEAVDYAVKLEASSARSNWLLLGIAILGGVILFGGPVIMTFLVKARSGASDLATRFGTLMARVRHEMPESASGITSIADEVVDDKHKTLIGKIADRVHSEFLMEKAKAQVLLGKV